MCCALLSKYLTLSEVSQSLNERVDLNGSRGEAKSSEYLLHLVSNENNNPTQRLLAGRLNEIVMCKFPGI